MAEIKASLVKELREKNMVQIDLYGTRIISGPLFFFFLAADEGCNRFESFNIIADNLDDN